MFEFAIFFFFAAVAVIFALVVVLHRNPVVGALALVASFFALAVMYVLLEAPFLAALQVIGYASSAAFLIGLAYYIVKYAAFTALPAGPFNSDARAIGTELFQAYIFPFEMVSILLLAAIVGALLLSARSVAR